MVEALEKTDLMGVYGRIRFNPKNHQVIPALDPKEGAVGTDPPVAGGQESRGLSEEHCHGRDPVTAVDEEVGSQNPPIPPFMKGGRGDFGFGCIKENPDSV